MEQKKRVNIVRIKLVRDRSILYEPRKLTSPRDSVRLARNFLKDSDREGVVIITLDTKNQPTSIELNSLGTIDASLMHPREVYKTAILQNSASIIIVHNHPSNETNPSREDRKATKRIKEAGEIIGIKLLDHIIMGDDSHNYYSFKEEKEL